MYWMCRPHTGCVRQKVTVWAFKAPQGVGLCWRLSECWCDVSGMMTHSMGVLEDEHAYAHTQEHAYVRVFSWTQCHAPPQDDSGETKHDMTRKPLFYLQLHWCGCHSDKFSCSLPEFENLGEEFLKRQALRGYLPTSSVFVSKINHPFCNIDEVVVRRTISVQTSPESPDAEDKLQCHYRF